MQRFFYSLFCLAQISAGKCSCGKQDKTDQFFDTCIKAGKECSLQVKPMKGSYNIIG